MPLYENPPAMTAMKVTKEWIEWGQKLINDTTPVADDDPIFNEYIVYLEDGESMTLAPSLEAFLEIFEWVNGETPGELAPIKYRD
jgi:hypothetical protein